MWALGTGLRNAIHKGRGELTSEAGLTGISIPLNGENGVPFVAARAWGEMRLCG